jgi:hypothetical protein
MTFLVSTGLSLAQLVEKAVADYPALIKFHAAGKNARASRYMDRVLKSRWHSFQIKFWGSHSMTNESKQLSKLSLLATKAPALALLLLGIMYGSFFLVSSQRSLAVLAGLLIGIGSLGIIIGPLVFRRFPHRQRVLCITPLR